MALTTEPNLRQTTSVYANLAHEDLMDMLERVEPAQTPVFTLAKSEYEMGNTEFAWEVDNWPNPNGALGPGDGYAVTTGEIRNRAQDIRKMGNYGQAFRRGFGAGWIANRVPKLPGIGKGGLISEAAADAMVLVKQDMEVAFTSFDQTATADVGSASGSLMAGIPKLIDAANRYGGASSFSYGKPTDIHYAPTAAVTSGPIAQVFSLAGIRTIVKALRTAVKMRKDYAFICGLDLREAVTGLIDPAVNLGATATGWAAKQQWHFSQALTDSQLGVSIDVIRTDYGRLLVMDTDLIGKTLLDVTGGTPGDGARANRVYTNLPKFGLIISKEKLGKRWGVAPEIDELQNDGGGTNKQVRCYGSIRVGNPQGFGSLALT